MESEDDGMPFLKYCNENPGNYLLQNGYELHDTLPGESILTEIETPGTWQTECYPILVNGSSLGGNDNSAISRSDNNKNISQPTVFKDLNLNDNTNISRPTSGNKDLDMVQTLSANSPELQNVFNHHSLIIKLNADIDSQSNDQKRNILLNANGTNAINSSKKQHNYFKPNSEVKESESIIEGNIIQVLSSDVEIDNCTRDSDTCQYYFVTTKPSEDSSSSDNDTCFWQNFYSILTALKCKLCSFLCERTEEMSDHMKRKHRDLLILKKRAEGENGKLNVTRKKMKSLLNPNPNTRPLTEYKNGNSLILFICSFCNEIFATREILMDHITEVHRGSQTEGSEANGSTEIDSLNSSPKTTMRNLATTLLKKQKREMSRVRCSVTGCCLKFASDEIKARHEKCHMRDKKQLQCPVCEEKFSMWRVCSKHLWTSHNVDAGLYTCPICKEYKSNSPVVVMDHMDIHNIEKPFICRECGKGFKQLTQLRNHAGIHKKDNNITAWSLSRKCTICERYFANPKSLKKHIQSVHEKLKPYVCNICGHKTARKAMLELHLRQHTGDKPYHCPHCTYKTGDHNCLRRHMMWHYGSMKYFCPHCKYQSIQSSAYKNHLANRHPEAEVTFKCSVCPFTTVNSDSYLTHVKIHELAQKGENGKNQKITMNDLPQKLTINGYENNIQENDETHDDLHLPNHSDHSEESIVD